MQKIKAVYNKLENNFCIRTMTELMCYTTLVAKGVLSAMDPISKSDEFFKDECDLDCNLCPYKEYCAAWLLSNTHDG